MTFITPEIVFLRKIQKYKIFCLFFGFFNLLLNLIDEKLPNTLSAFEEGAVEQILSGKLWLYGVKNSFRPILIDFLIVVGLLFSF